MGEVCSTGLCQNDSKLIPRDSFIAKSKKQKKISKPKITGPHVLFGDDCGHLFEHSIDQNKITHNFEQFNDKIITIVIAPNKKSIYVATALPALYKFDLQSYKLIKKMKMSYQYNENISITSRYLIIQTYNHFCLELWSIQNQKLICTIKLHTTESIRSLTCSKDNNFVFIGHDSGYLSIVSIKNNQILKTTKDFDIEICSIIIFKDNQNAIVSDFDGHIKKLNWKQDAKNDYDFQYIKNYGNVSGSYTTNICLNNNEDSIFICSYLEVFIQNLDTGKKTAKFILCGVAKEVELVENGEKAVVVQDDGKIFILDLDVLGITEIDHGHELTNGNHTRCTKIIT